MTSVKRLAILMVVLISTIALPEPPRDSRGHSYSMTAGSDWSWLAESMENMHIAMASTKPSGESDVDFVNLMLPHHHAAIDMAKMQLAYGKDPQMRRLAQEIITDQQSEIELMKLWLKQRQTSSLKANQNTAANANKEP